MLAELHCEGWPLANREQLNTVEALLSCRIAQLCFIRVSEYHPQLKATTEWARAQGQADPSLFVDDQSPVDLAAMNAAMDARIAEFRPILALANQHVSRAGALSSATGGAVARLTNLVRFCDTAGSALSESESRHVLGPVDAVVQLHSESMTLAEMRMRLAELRDSFQLPTESYSQMRYMAEFVASGSADSHVFLPAFAGTTRKLRSPDQFVSTAFAVLREADEQVRMCRQAPSLMAHVMAAYRAAPLFRVARRLFGGAVERFNDANSPTDASDAAKEEYAAEEMHASCSEVAGMMGASLVLGPRYHMTAKGIEAPDDVVEYMSYLSRSHVFVPAFALNALVVARRESDFRTAPYEAYAQSLFNHMHRMDASLLMWALEADAGKWR